MISDMDIVHFGRSLINVCRAGLVGYNLVVPKACNLFTTKGDKVITKQERNSKRNPSKKPYGVKRIFSFALFF